MFGPGYVPVTVRNKIFYRGLHVYWDLYIKAMLIGVVIDAIYYLTVKINKTNDEFSIDCAEYHAIIAYVALMLVTDYVCGFFVLPWLLWKLKNILRGARNVPGTAHDGFSFANPLSTSTEFDDYPDWRGQQVSLLSGHGYTHYRNEFIDENVVTHVLAKRSGSAVIGNDNLQRFILNEITTDFPTVPLGVQVSSAARAYQVLLCMRSYESLTSVPARGGELPRVTW